MNLEFQKCIGLRPVIQHQEQDLFLKLLIQQGPWPRDCWGERNTAIEFSQFWTDNQPFSVWYCHDGLHLCVRRRAAWSLPAQADRTKDWWSLEQSSHWWNPAATVTLPPRMSQDFFVCSFCIVRHYPHHSTPLRKKKKRRKNTHTQKKKPRTKQQLQQQKRPNKKNPNKSYFGFAT